MAIKEEYEWTYDALKALGVTGMDCRSDGTVHYQNETDAPDPAVLQAKIDELKAAGPLEKLRARRNRRLFETDHWALADRTMTQEQIDYRQALRDITSTYSSIDDEGFAWPQKPSE